MVHHPGADHWTWAGSMLLQFWKSIISRKFFIVTTDIEVHRSLMHLFIYSLIGRLGLSFSRTGRAQGINQLLIDYPRTALQLFIGAGILSQMAAPLIAQHLQRPLRIRFRFARASREVMAQWPAHPEPGRCDARKVQISQRSARTGQAYQGRRQFHVRNFVFIAARRLHLRIRTAFCLCDLRHCGSDSDVGAFLL